MSRKELPFFNLGERTFLHFHPRLNVQGCTTVKAMVHASVKVAFQYTSLVNILIVPPQPTQLEPARTLKTGLNLY